VRIAIVAARASRTNLRLASAGGAEWSWLTPKAALEQLGPGDAALGRLDVLPTLDGIDGGLRVLGELEARRVRVLNPAGALLAAHDKLVTARVLEGASLPHPRTRFASAGWEAGAWAGPVVVKPRFGSWGRAVHRCDDGASLAALLGGLGTERWFALHGAIVQELVEPAGHDLRILVAGGRAVGAISRVAARGEWRTNVALGARRRRVTPPDDAVRIALAAAEAARADLVGVDLLPLPDGGWTIIELNGAVEFTSAYSQEGDVFAAAVRELELRAVLEDREAPRTSPAPL
jgi:[lysine-biosynthesis-protein LysW]---L-2-aminoadipate ligase